MRAARRAGKKAASSTIARAAKKHTLTITPEGRKPIVVSLTGTDAAFNALRTCQEAQKPK